MDIVDYAIVVFTVFLLGLFMYTVFYWDIDAWILITRLGDSEFYLIASVLVFFLVGSPVDAMALIASVLLAGSLNISLKYLFNTPRPLNPLVEVSGPGFPSGHSMVSTSFWTTLSLVARRKTLVFLSLLVVTSVSISRIVLRAHFPIDVVGGLVFGFMTGLISYYARLTCGERLGGLGMVLIGFMSLVLGFINVFLLGVELEASTSLLGLSIVLFVYAVFSQGGICIILSRLSTRLLGFIVSSGFLLFIHYSTKAIIVYYRIIGFTIGGLVVFILVPWLLHRFIERG